LYYPWIKAPIEIENDNHGTIVVYDKYLPESGYVAGVYARSDAERGVHKPPANEIIHGVHALKFEVSQG
jgi:hypothetical protein